MRPTDTPPAEVRLRRAPLAFGVAVALGAGLLADWIAPAPGEPAWLRWLRVLADHPFRSAAAASLLFAAVSPRTRDPGGPGPTPTA